MFKRFSGVALPMFFILPVIGFIFSLFNFRSKTTALIYVGFAMLFGYSISFSNSSADSFRYALAFANFDNTLNYNKIVDLYQAGELRDLYRLLLFYFTSLFTSNPKVMYAVAGLVYGILSYWCLSLFVRERGPGWDNYTLILSVIFFTYISISGINSFRFNTGALLFFYSTYRLIIKRDTLWIIGVLLTPFIHYGFIAIVPVVLIYSLVGRWFYSVDGVSKLLYFFFILTFVVSWFLGTNSINIGFLSQSEALSGAVGSRLEYINSHEVAEIVDNREESSTFVAFQKYFSHAVKLYVFVVILYLRNLFGRFKGDKTRYTRLFAFVLFFYSVSFIASSIPSGGRFLSIAHLFLIILLSMCYAIYKGKDIKRIIMLSIPVFIFHILFLNIMLPILVLTPSLWYANIFWIIGDGLNFYIL